MLCSVRVDPLHAVMKNFPVGTSVHCPSSWTRRSTLRGFASFLRYEYTCACNVLITYNVRDICCACQEDRTSRAITGSDFFRRHPALHPALLAHLATAVDRLEAGDAGHPSLVPVLALIARLRCHRSA